MHVLECNIVNNTVFIHPIPVILSRKNSVNLQYIHTFAIANLYYILH